MHDHKGRTMTDNASEPRTSPPEQGGVQPHSQGEHYPAIIAQIESWANGERRYTCFEVQAFGHAERYATEADAYAAAREVSRRGAW